MSTNPCLFRTISFLMHLLQSFTHSHPKCCLFPTNATICDFKYLVEQTTLLLKVSPMFKVYINSFNIVSRINS